MSEKLQKVLARKGIASRRAVETLIAQGRVAVNGVKAQLGDRIEDDVTVTVDSKVVMRPGEGKVSCRVLMYHKPEGELTTLKDPEDRPTVFDHLPSLSKGRWIYIGRLDINTSGLLLFTTDGALANALMHPRHGIERIYAARIYGDVDDETIARLEHEVKLEDGPAHFDKVQYAGGDGRNVWFHCTLKEGRKREVRRLWEAVGCKVSRLIRISYGGVRLDPKLKSGAFRDLSLREINMLRKEAALEPLTEDEYQLPQILKKAAVDPKKDAKARTQKSLESRNYAKTADNKGSSRGRRSQNSSHEQDLGSRGKGSFEHKKPSKRYGADGRSRVGAQKTAYGSSPKSAQGNKNGVRGLKSRRVTMG